MTTSDLDYDRVLVSAKPRYPNLRKWDFAAVLIWSKDALAVFWYQLPVKASGWERYELPKKAPWHLAHFERPTLPDVPDYLCQVVVAFFKRVMSEVVRRYGDEVEQPQNTGSASEGAQSNGQP